MPDRLSYTLQRHEFVAGLQAVVGSMTATDMHRRWSRRLRLIPWVYYNLMGAAAVLAVWLFPEDLRGLIFFVVVFLLAQVAISWFVERTEKAQIGATFEPRRNTDVTAAFDPDGVSYIGREHQQVWNWTLLQRFHELPAVYVLEFAGFDMLVVPRRAFASTGEADDWAAGIRSRLVTAEAST